MGKLLEICVDTVDGLDIAIANGADRIELCSALGLGGLTPSVGLMAYAAKKSVPIYAMIRPRDGNFCFNPCEKEVMLSEITAVHAAGLAGVVLGASCEDGSLDISLLQELCEYAQSLSLGTTLHRAFDLVPDTYSAIEQAVALKFERILTSGQQLKAIDGLELLEKINAKANGRIIIMPGSGVTSENARSIIQAANFNEIHASGREVIINQDQRSIDFGFAPPEIAQTSADKVRTLKQALMTL